MFSSPLYFKLLTACYFIRLSTDTFIPFISVFTLRNIIRDFKFQFYQLPNWRKWKTFICVWFWFMSKLQRNLLLIMLVSMVFTSIADLQNITTFAPLKCNKLTFNFWLTLFFLLHIHCDWITSKFSLNELTISVHRFVRNAKHNCVFICNFYTNFFSRSIRPGCQCISVVYWKR